ncbi:MAG: LacI family DNA-binding transcriptional regulator [Anaerolineales bacterium]|nr:LacI family DNA-binding transcriptional regulator [Anaerolineales bacterium]
MVASKHVTILQVARKAGVSAQTVSRVINDRPDVAPETRLRVQQIINDMGYRPNVIARSLIHRRSYSLGVVATGLDYYGPSNTVIGIEKQARTLGYSLLLDLLHHPDAVDVEQLLNRLLSRQVDGIIWAVPEIGDNRNWLQRKTPEIPAPIIYLSMAPNPRLTTVSVDNRLGGELAARHLIEQGYRHIGHITGPMNWWEARQRLAGWQDTLKEAGLPAAEHQIAHGDWSAASGEQAMRSLLTQFPQVEAIFASNDQMALGALTFAYQQGMRVPQDLALVGFDDIPEAAYYYPRLTTVRQNLIDLGGISVSELVRMIESHHKNEPSGEPQTIWLPPELVVRASSIRE